MWVEKNNLLLPAKSLTQTPASKSLALSADGNVLAASSDSTITIYIYGAGNWRLEASLPSNSGGREAAFSANGNILVVGSHVYVRAAGTWIHQAALFPSTRAVTVQQTCDSANKFSCYAKTRIDRKSVV